MSLQFEGRDLVDFEIWINLEPFLIKHLLWMTAVEASLMTRPMLNQRLFS